MMKWRWSYTLIFKTLKTWVKERFCWMSSLGESNRSQPLSRILKSTVLLRIYPSAAALTFNGLNLTKIYKWSRTKKAEWCPQQLQRTKKTQAKAWVPRKSSMVVIWKWSEQRMSSTCSETFRTQQTSVLRSECTEKQVNSRTQPRRRERLKYRIRKTHLQSRGNHLWREASLGIKKTMIPVLARRTLAREGESQKGRKMWKQLNLHL